MKQLLIIPLLIISIGTWGKAEPLQGPTLDPLPKGLPPAVSTPSAGGECSKPGTWIPEKTGKALNLEREQCKRLPETCQKLLDLSYKQAERDKQHAINMALVNKKKGFTLYEVLGITGGSLVVGALVGALVVALGT